MSSKRNPKFINFGNMKEGFGRRIYHDPGFQFSPKFRDVFNTYPMENGLRKGNLSVNKLGNTIGTYNDNQFYRWNFTRRNFLKTAVITTITGGLLSCAKEENPIEEITEPPTPIITGPKELTIPHVGMGAIGTFDSAGTKGATDLYWQLIKPISIVENLEQKGNQPKVDISFAIPGTNEVRLIADNKSGRSRLSHFVKINPPKLPDQNYDLPLLLMIRETRDNPVYGVYTLDTKTNVVTKIFSDRYYYDYISWEPTGQRMVFVTNPQDQNNSEAPHKISTYDLTSGTFKEISNNSQYLAWCPKWSPKGDWIAYLDDSKSYNRSVDVVSLVRPDGSEQFYLDGAGQSEQFSASGLSWNPEGNKLIASTGHFYNSKLITYYDLFSGNPKVSSVSLPTLEQIERYYDSKSEIFLKTGLTKVTFINTFESGLNGLAWSPDGQFIVYSANFGLHPDNYYALLLSRVDGIGDILTIATSHGPSGEGIEFWLPIRPTWTPDGLAIYFSATKYNEQYLFKYDMTTKTYEQVMLSISGVEKVSLYD